MGLISPLILFTLLVLVLFLPTPLLVHTYPPPFTLREVIIHPSESAFLLGIYAVSITLLLVIARHFDG